MEKILECPICLEIPKSTPIYQCETGHIYCKSCNQNISKCSFCRSKTIKIRALVAEQIIANLFAKEYCDTCESMVFVKDLNKHGLDCNLVQCILCHQKVKIKQLLSNF